MMVHSPLDVFGKEARDFFFVQVGAYDGATGDPIYQDVVKHKWRGLLIEPIPDLFERLRKTYENHRGLIFENVAISDREETRTIYRLQPCKQGQQGIWRWADLCASFDRALASRHMGEENLVAQEVNCVPLRSLVERHGIRKIDLLQIDVEGYDYDVLLQVDFAGWNVQQVRYEHRHLDAKRRVAARQLLVKNGFEIVSSGRWDTLAVRKTLLSPGTGTATPSGFSRPSREMAMNGEQAMATSEGDDSLGRPSRGVLFFNRGTKCLIRLLVCLHSLRKWWTGPVTLFLDGPHPPEFLESLKAFGVSVVPSDNPESGAFIRKVEICFETPYERSLWLDSDTIVCGPIDELFDSLDQHDVVTPHFAGWWSHGRKLRQRIEQYRGRCPDEWLEVALQPHPAVNMGVFAFRRGVPFLEPWLELSRKGDHKQVTLPEEIAFQILYPRFPVGIVSAKFGASVKHDPGTEDIRVVHYHGQKHVHDFPLCEHWKTNFRELLDSGQTRLGDLLFLSDRRLRKHLGVHEHVTIVTACDARYVEKLRLTFPTWVRHKHILRYPVVVFVHGIPLDDRRLDFLRYPGVRLVEWDFPVDDQRERMLSAFVFGTARHVESKWWMKLDADSWATDGTPLITEEMKGPAFYGHKWGRSRTEHILALDHWAAAHPRLQTPPMFDPSRVQGDKFIYPRTQSFAQLEATWFTRLCAKLAGNRLPVPSQDTFGFYVADRLGHSIGRTNFKKHHGMNHSGRLRRLREQAGA